VRSGGEGGVFYEQHLVPTGKPAQEYEYYNKVLRENVHRKDHILDYSVSKTHASERRNPFCKKFFAKNGRL
jgi:hypothetical protein